MSAIEKAYRWITVVVWALIASLLVSTDGYGQAKPDTTQLRSSSPKATVEVAVGLLEQDRMRDAIPLLRHLVKRRPDYVSPRTGAAAYWLGFAYAQIGKEEEARQAWARGLKALGRSNRFEVRLADVFLQSQTPESLQRYRTVVRSTYWKLLGYIGPKASSAEQAIFRRYMAQLAPLLPDETLKKVIHQPRTTQPAQWTFRDGSGTALQAWWRRQDTYPSTVRNERLDEHLTRLVKAQNAYACPSRVSGLDGRGQVFVRFGPPHKKQAVTYNDGDFFRDVIRFGVGVSISDFPDNELWSYSHIDEAGYYLFAKSRRCFHIAEANDLLPKRLRQRRGTSERGLNIAYSSLMAMRHIYRNLALFHPDFSNRFSKIAQYANWQETRGLIAEAREATGGGQIGGHTVGAGRGQERRVFASKQFSIAPPNRFISQMVKRAHREDRAAAKRRANAMPRQHTKLREQTESLPVAVRTARFLTPNDATRTEVYWGLRTKHLQLKDGAFSGAVISLNGVRYDTTYNRQKDVERQYVIRNERMRNDRILYPAPISIPGATEPYHLALQWLQFDADVSASGTVSLGKFRRDAVVRSDSIRPLRAEGRKLEMSDVQVRVLETPDTAATEWMEASKPYPFRTISASAPLLLYFELYHLAFGPNDQTRYSIAYVVESKTQHGWARIFRDPQTERVSMSSTYSGTSRRTDELIALDLSSVVRERAQAVRVTVRVTDEVAQTRVERSVSFAISDD